MMRVTEQYAPFYEAAYNTIGAAMRSMLDRPRSESFTPESTSIAAIAVALALSPINDADLDLYIERLPELAREVRALYGIGARRS